MRWERKELAWWSAEIEASMILTKEFIDSIITCKVACQWLNSEYNKGLYNWMVFVQTQR